MAASVNGDSWGNQVPVLAKHHEVIVADSRGHGRSTRSSQPFGYELMANDYLALLDHLKIDKVALVGWSDGGILGLDIAMRHPERVSQIVGVRREYESRAGLKPNFDDRTLCSPPPSRRRVRNTRVCRRRRTNTMPSSPPSARCGTRSQNYKPEQISKIVTPTVIAVGEYDEAIKREHTEEIARLIPGAKLLIIPGVSHYAAWQNPELYNRELTAFLDSGGG